VSGIRRLSTKCWLGTLVRTLRRTDGKRRAHDSRQSSRHHCHLPVVSFIWPNVSGQLGHTINLCERPNLMRSSSADGIAEPRLPPIHPIPMLASSWRPPRVISVVPVAVSLEVEMLQAKRKSPQRVDPKRRMACSGTRASHRWRRASASSKLVGKEAERTQAWAPHRCERAGFLFGVLSVRQSADQRGISQIVSKEGAAVRRAIGNRLFQPDSGLDCHRREHMTSSGRRPLSPTTALR
jgi:hypothetical protein